MKYDSGMKQFHKNIAEAVKAMLRKSELDEVKGLLGDGSPVSLREYLKKTQGVSHHGGNKFDCSPQNFSVRFDSFLNNTGDKLLTLSWSQLATFIRNNSELIFEGDKNEDAPIISKDSFEVFANTFDESKVKCAYWIKGNDVLHANTFGGLSFQCELHNQNFCDLSKLRSHTAMCCGDYTRCISYRKAMEEMNNAPAEQTDSVPAVFDYTVLNSDDADVAMKYRERHLHRQQSYYLDEAKDLAEIQERLAKYDGGTFVKWIETETEYSTKSVYNLIDIYNQFCKFTKPEQETFIALPKTLQIDISAKSAPPELVEQVMNGDITTHKEYIELKKQLDETKGNLEMSKDDVQKAEERAKYAENANSKLSVKNSELERRVKELENRPVDVAVPDEEEIERLSLEKSKGLLRAKDMECDRRLREMQDESRDKDKEISELKERLMTIGENSEQIENFFEDMYNDAYRALKRCFEFVSESGFTPQTVNKLRLRLNSFSGVVNDFIEEMQQ